MPSDPHDPRDIPILTEAVGALPVSARFDTKALHAAILGATLELADSLLHQAAKDIEATLFERVFDRLRGELPELVDGIMREHAGTHATELAQTEPAITMLAAPGVSAAPPEEHG